MNKITATFRIVTPMFISGADQSQAELRAPSVKGALRFWYRALHPAADPKEEFRIFGGTDKEAGQACFSLRLMPDRQGGPDGEAGDQRWKDSKISYLGYGVIDRRETGEYREDGTPIRRPMTVRPYYKEENRFTLEILFKPYRLQTSKPEYEAMILKVKRSLWGLIMLGGLGARSRRGFGSIAVEEIDGMDGLPDLNPPNHQALEHVLHEFFCQLDEIDNTGNGYPEYTCLSAASRFVVTRPQGAAMDALEWLGETMHKYRSYRSSSRMSCVNGDHDLMRAWVASGTRPGSPPKRTAFGLPHNYFFSSLKNGGEINFMDKGGKGRRASPLFFRIHEFPPSGGIRRASVVANFLPARLIPDGKKLRFSATTHEDTCELELPDDFSAVTELLKHIAGDGKTVVRNHV